MGTTVGTAGEKDGLNEGAVRLNLNSFAVALSFEGCVEVAFGTGGEVVFGTGEAVLGTGETVLRGTGDVVLGTEEVALGTGTVFLSAVGFLSLVASTFCLSAGTETTVAASFSVLCMASASPTIGMAPTPSAVLSALVPSLLFSSPRRPPAAVVVVLLLVVVVAVVVVAAVVAVVAVVVCDGAGVFDFSAVTSTLFVPCPPFFGLASLAPCVFSFTGTPFVLIGEGGPTPGGAAKVVLVAAVAAVNLMPIIINACMHVIVIVKLYLADKLDKTRSVAIIVMIGNQWL